MSDIDLEKYRRHVANLDMPEERKTELLRAVWHIMQNFVDRAFGHDPVQQALRAGGNSEIDAAPRIPDMLELQAETPDKNNENSLAGAFREGTGKGAAAQRIQKHDRPKANESSHLLPRFDHEAEGWRNGRLEPQDMRRRQYAQSTGYEIEAVFPDRVSGGGDFMNRPGMVALLSYLDAQRETSGHVVIFDATSSVSRGITMSGAGTPDKTTKIASGAFRKGTDGAAAESDSKS